MALTFRHISVDLLRRILSEPNVGLSVKNEIEMLISEENATLPIVPLGFGLMPDHLTAENGAKCLLINEFYESIRYSCPECDDLDEPDEQCEICNGHGEHDIKIQITWSSIKDIYEKAFTHLSKTAVYQHSNVSKERFEMWFQTEYGTSFSEKINWDDDRIQAMFQGWLAHNKTYGSKS